MDIKTARVAYFRTLAFKLGNCSYLARYLNTCMYEKKKQCVWLKICKFE